MDARDGVVVRITAAALRRGELTMPRADASSYRTKVRKPSDFDAFWDDVLRQASAIPLDAQALGFNWDQPELPKSLEAVTLGHETEDEATEVYCGASADNGTPEVYVPPGGATSDYCDMTETDGQHHFWLYTARGRSLSYRILSFARGYPVRLHGVVLSVVTPSLSEVEG